MTEKKILIIENDLTMLQTLKEALELNNYLIEISSTGLEGIEIAKEFKPNLVICDLILTDISGYEVFNQIRSTYFLFLTGTAPRKWKLLPMSFHLQKPVSLEILTVQIERILNPIG